MREFTAIITPMILGLCALFIVGCSKKAPEGTAYFVVVRYEASGAPYAAWISTQSCSTSQTRIGGYDDDMNEIFNEPVDSDSPNDKKILDEQCLDVNKSGAFYQIYQKVWRGKKPDKQFLDNVQKEDLVAFGKEEIKVPKAPTKAAPTIVKKMVQVTEVKEPKPSYTYKVKWERDEYFRYQAIIVRNDDVEIASFSRKSKAEELIKYLK